WPALRPSRHRPGPDAGAHRRARLRERRDAFYLHGDTRRLYPEGVDDRPPATGSHPGRIQPVKPEQRSARTRGAWIQIPPTDPATRQRGWREGPVVFRRDISMDARGPVLEVVEEVVLASLPPAVKKGLTKAAGSGTIDKVESLTKKGKLVAYEAVVQQGKK